ncbi:MAG TPA: ATP-binding protein, partial [Gammaproteobacteria bacterium]
SHLAQYESSRALASAKRFEEVNRLSAFIMHDLKNMIGQLSMVVSNASRHKTNPLFIEDAISTVDNSVAKMNKLLARLRGGGGHDNVQLLSLCELLEEVIRTCSKAGALPVPVLNCQAQEVRITADKDRIIANLGHILQNAQEATDSEGKITVRLKRDKHFAIIEVEDTGCGMDDEFIQKKLFQPFESTKGTMGIGVFQVREYIYKLGGDMDVESKKGIGTTFKLSIPVANLGDNVIRHPQMINK